MRIRFIVNPIAGIGNQKGIEKLITDNIGFSHDFVYTKKAGDAT